MPICRLMTGSSAAIADRQHAEALVESLRELFGRERADPRCCQFEGKWYLVEPATDFRNTRYALNI
jgi:hypothetical protein